MFFETAAVTRSHLFKKPFAIITYLGILYRFFHSGRLKKQRRRCHCLDQSEAYWLGGLVRTILNTRTLHNCFKFHMCTKMHDERDTTQFVVILHHPETPSHSRTCSQYFHSGTQYPKLLSLLPISKIQDSGRSLRLDQITYAPTGENPF